MESPDVRLMLRFQKGDEDAFKALFKKFSDRIVNYAARFLGSRARAEEIAQDVFLSLFKARHRYKPDSEFSTWLFRITHNACVNALRRSGRREEVSEEDGPRAEACTPSVESEFFRKEVRDRVLQLLDGLPESQRAAVILTRLEGFSYVEVAEVLGCSLPAVKSSVFRATHVLREGLREFLP